MIIFANFLQVQPAFIISNYKTESFLSEIKKRGLAIRKEKAEAAGKDYRLMPLSEEELKCAEILGLNSADVSQYENQVFQFIKTFLETSEKPGEHFEELLNKLPHVEKPQTGTKRLPFEKSIAGTLKNLQENQRHVLLKIIKEMTWAMDSTDLKNLTQSLLYDIVVADSSLEFDTFILLPRCRLIIGGCVDIVSQSYTKFQTKPNIYRIASSEPMVIDILGEQKQLKWELST
jgi:hypothetical protein